jgi:hypothetical protein
MTFVIGGISFYRYELCTRDQVCVARRQGPARSPLIRCPRASHSGGYGLHGLWRKFAKLAFGGRDRARSWLMVHRGRRALRRDPPPGVGRRLKPSVDLRLHLVDRLRAGAREAGQRRERKCCSNQCHHLLHAHGPISSTAKFIAHRAPRPRLAAARAASGHAAAPSHGAHPQGQRPRSSIAGQDRASQQNGPLMSALGQEPTSPVHQPMSALPPKADK